jgi:TetR/AcrR family transcriptional repressor of nem operon
MTLVMSGTLMTLVTKQVKTPARPTRRSMRVSKEQAAQNRQKILTAATRLFRERGINATGVDAISENAGLTHGAVYSQFGSKEAIAAEAVRLALVRSKYLWDRMADRRGKKRGFPAIVAHYLSAEHRDLAGQGCVVAALGSEIARQPRSVRDAFTREFKNSLSVLAELMREEDPSCSNEDAIAAFASMAGALILARAVSEEGLSNRILEATAKRVFHLAGSEGPSARLKRTSTRIKTCRLAK